MKWIHFGKSSHKVGDGGGSDSGIGCDDIRLCPWALMLFMCLIE